MGRSCPSSSSTQPDPTHLGCWPDLDPLDRWVADRSGLSGMFVSLSTPSKSVSLGRPDLARSSGQSVSPELSNPSRLSGWSSPTRSSSQSGLSSQQVGWVVGLSDTSRSTLLSHLAR